MIGKTNAVIGEIERKVEITFTIEGAKGDNITITDESGEIVGNVVFDTDAVSKEYTMMIVDGANYTFTSSVAKDIDTGTSDYSKIVTLISGFTNTVKVMPDGIISYWYGNNSDVWNFPTAVTRPSFYYFALIDCIAGSGNGTLIRNKNINNITLKIEPVNNVANGTASVYSDLIDFSKYTKLTINKSASFLGLNKTDPTNRKVYEDSGSSPYTSSYSWLDSKINSLSITKIDEGDNYRTYDISNVNDSYRLVIGTYSCNAVGNTSILEFAILE